MLLHASHPNTSDRNRLAYIASYMGEEYIFCGLGDPEFLVARELKRECLRKPELSIPETLTTPERLLAGQTRNPQLARSSLPWRSAVRLDRGRHRLRLRVSHLLEPL